MLAADAPVAASTATTGQLVVQILLTLGIGGVVASITQAFLSRRKTKADVRKLDADADGSAMAAASALTASNIQLLQRMDTDMARMAARQADLERELSDLRQRIEEGQERERGHVRQLTAYREWAEVASRKLSDAGIPVNPPPHDGPAWPPLPPSQRTPPD